MKVLVTGTKGQLGYDVVNELENSIILISLSHRHHLLWGKTD